MFVSRFFPDLILKEFNASKMILFFHISPALLPYNTNCPATILSNSKLFSRLFSYKTSHNRSKVIRVARTFTHVARTFIRIAKIDFRVARTFIRVAQTFIRVARTFIRVAQIDFRVARTFIRVAQIDFRVARTFIRVAKIDFRAFQRKTESLFQITILIQDITFINYFHSHINIK